MRLSDCLWCFYSKFIGLFYYFFSVENMLIYIVIIYFIVMCRTVVVRWRWIRIIVFISSKRHSRNFTVYLYQSLSDIFKRFHTIHANIFLKVFTLWLVNLSSTSCFLLPVYIKDAFRFRITKVFVYKTGTISLFE